MYTFEELAPELAVELPLGGYGKPGFRDSGKPRVPVIGLGPEGEGRRNGGVADSHGADLDAEEPRALARQGVEPVHRLPVLLAEGHGDPYDGGGIGSGGVGQQLP